MDQIPPSDPDVMESSVGQSEDPGTVSGDVEMESQEPLIAEEQGPVGQGVPNTVVSPLSCYALRNRNQRRQPTRLMMTTVACSSGRTGWREGVM